MKALVVFSHPEPKSFNGALFATAVECLKSAGHEVQISDLYRMNFSPVSSRDNFNSLKNPNFLKLQMEEVYATEHHSFAPELEAEIEKVEWCDLMIWQFPLWWFSMPALLKGWVDRVFAMGRAYGMGKVYDTGAFRGKRALLCVTTGGPAEAYEQDGFNGDIHGILRPIERGMLQFVGFDVLAPSIYYGPARQEESVRIGWLAEWADRLKGIETESPIVVGRY